MPVHDWTRVEAGIFHDFHNAWLTEIRNALNGGLLPPGYYALTEQHAGMYIADVLTLQTSTPGPPPVPPAPAGESGGVAVAEAPPKVRRKLTSSAVSRQRRRTLAVRHVSGHRLVAILEIVSSANKDRASHVEQFADKAEDALHHGVHLLLVDLFPPGAYDPQGMFGAIWERFSPVPYDLPAGEPLTLASVLARPEPESYLEHLAVGAPVPPMPLFLPRERYVNVPFEATYQAAYRGVPGFWRDVVEGHAPPAA